MSYLDTLKTYGLDDVPELRASYRHGGALVIARCMAVIADLASTPAQIDSAGSMEAMMRDRHGDPKAEWLDRQVAEATTSRVKLKAFLASFVDGDDEPSTPTGWRRSEIRAVAYLMAHGEYPDPEPTRRKVTISDVLRMRPAPASRQRRGRPA